MGRKRPFEVRHPWKGKRFLPHPGEAPPPATRKVEQKILLSKQERPEGSPEAAPEARFLWNQKCARRRREEHTIRYQIYAPNGAAGEPFGLSSKKNSVFRVRNCRNCIHLTHTRKMGHITNLTYC